MSTRRLASSGFSRYCYPGFKASVPVSQDGGRGGGREMMFGSWGKSPRQSNVSDSRGEEPWLAVSLRPENFVPGLVIGFLMGLFLDLSRPGRGGKSLSAPGKQRTAAAIADSNGEELKMVDVEDFIGYDRKLTVEQCSSVLIVRQDLKMGAGKIASQCAHAATGTYAELIHSHRSLLRRWEQCGQPKIVLCCKNQQEMNKLKETADRAGLPTFVVADAGRTQVAAGSKTVLAIGPGRKALIDSITGRLRLM